MKAFIFNSGTGTRLNDLTSKTPKALVRMKTGETILGRQIRLLANQGIKDFVVTTGPFPEQIAAFVKQYKNLNFTLVASDNYLNTNSIYSMHLASAKFDDDFLILHGDLVFDEAMVRDILASKEENLVLVNRSIPKPPKDFKGRIEGNYLRQISVDIFDLDCFALQPFYRLTRATIKLWLDKIADFIKRGETKVYAENALNLLLKDDLIKIFDYQHYFVDEIDNLADYHRVANSIASFDYQNQEVVTSDDYGDEIIKFMAKHHLKRPLLVYGRHLEKDSSFVRLVEKLKPIKFIEYSPNPKYEEIVLGHHLFKTNNLDSIIAIGGGSTLDVAKAIKLYSPYDIGEDFIKTQAGYVDLKLIAVPTTAGTGSESTRYSVIYYLGEKMSLTNDSLLPDLAVLTPSLLNGLPSYQRKATLLDALSQAIEGYWAVNSTPVAATYSGRAIGLILKYYQGYINGDNTNVHQIMEASNLAGRAINISATTAPHAMSYKITSLKGIAHGHAVALTLPFVYEKMVKGLDKYPLKMPKEALIERFNGLAECFGLDNYHQLVEKLKEVYRSFGLEATTYSEEELTTLVASVNLERLNNNPVVFDQSVLKEIYQSARTKTNN